MVSFSVLRNISDVTIPKQLDLDQAGQPTLRFPSKRQGDHGADSAAGIRDSVRVDIRALDHVALNINDGLSAAQTADGALQEISNLLTRAVTLAEQAGADATEPADRAALNSEFTEIEAEIAQIATETSYDGVGLFTTTGLNGSLSIFVGDISRAIAISARLAIVTTSRSAFTKLGGQELTAVDLTTKDGATSGLAIIQNALTGVNDSRAGIQAGITRLNAAVSDLQSQFLSNQAVESKILDTSAAEALAGRTKSQIQAEPDTATLAQANSNNQIALEHLLS